MTNYFSNLSDLVTDRKELSHYVLILAEDIKEHPDQYENINLYSFMEALSAYLVDLEGLFLNKGESVPQEPSWKLLAQILYSASIYE